MRGSAPCGPRKEPGANDDALGVSMLVVGISAGTSAGDISPTVSVDDSAASLGSGAFEGGAAGTFEKIKNSATSRMHAKRALVRTALIVVRP